MATKYINTDRDRLEEEARRLFNNLEERVDVPFTLGEGLLTLYGVQMVVSSLVDGCIPSSGEYASPDQIRTYFTAINVEISELLQELPWKPWKNGKNIDPHRVADEFADVLAFLGIIIVYLDRFGVSPSTLAQAYANKSRVNIQRMLGEVSGYDNPQNR